MKRLLRWLGFAAAGIAIVAVAALACLYIVPRFAMSRTYTTPISGFTARTDAESIARGKRLATVAGCNNCHGRDLAGAFMIDIPNLVRVVAPNLTAAVRRYSDGELERVIRHGVKRDGTSTWVMPSQMFTHLSDRDLGDIIAYVRSAPQRDGVEGELTLRSLGRIGVITGQLKPVAQQIEAARAAYAASTDERFARGRYLVQITCTECHGQDLRGSDMVHAPSLVASAAYSDDDFKKLLHAGVGSGGRELGLMGEMGRLRFASFEDDEVAAIRSYLNEFVRQGGRALP